MLQTSCAPWLKIALQTYGKKFAFGAYLRQFISRGMSLGSTTFGGAADTLAPGASSSSTRGCRLWLTTFGSGLCCLFTLGSEPGGIMSCAHMLPCVHEGEMGCCRDFSSGCHMLAACWTVDSRQLCSLVGYACAFFYGIILVCTCYAAGMLCLDTSWSSTSESAALYFGLCTCRCFGVEGSFPLLSRSFHNEHQRSMPDVTRLDRGSVVNKGSTFKSSQVSRKGSFT